MKIKIEVVDKDIDKAGDVIEELVWDIFDKYPGSEADFSSLNREKRVEFLVKDNRLM
tara:strand:+ start:202 stop:372 length:171 start_codon:yes stop_codon:yes gene_type:complete